MESTVPFPSGKTGPTAADQEEKLRHLPPEAREAFLRFQKEGDVAALDPVIHAILADFSPRALPQALEAVSDDTLLMEDLGFDSLAIAEIVFFTEDLFLIHIANEEILQVRTLGNLRDFVRRKVAERPRR
jgi:acyl carrier protein